MALWTPEVEAKGVWLDFSDTRQVVTSPEDQSKALTIVDKSGNSRHFSTSIYLPSYGAETLNGLPGVIFSTYQNMKVLGWTSGMNHVFAAVATPPTTGDRKYLWHGSSAVAFLNNAGMLGYYSGQEWQGDVAALAGPQILVWVLNNDTQTGIIRRNGAQVFQGIYRGWDNAGDVTDDGLIEIGGRSSFSNWSMSTIFEILKLDTIPSDQIIEKIEGYLAHKWGLVPDLDVLHPYKSNPPTIEQSSSQVSGVVQVNGTPAGRTVRAFGYDPIAHQIDGEPINLSKSLGQAVSDETTGEYTIDLLGGYEEEVFVVAFDDYGSDFTANMSVAVGDRVHPTTPNGYVFECLGAGTLPSEEPVWAVDTETPQLYGTASMLAKPFYRPMVHGPVKPEASGPTGYQHFRILFDSNPADLDWAGNIAEVELYDAASTKLAIASIDGNNNAGASYTPSKAIDGDPFTSWLARANGQGYAPPYYLYFQFSEPVEVASYKLMPSIYNTSTRTAESWRVEKSDDGVTWTEISAQSGITGWKREVFKEFGI